ncbi:MAG: hypothetical protein LBF62_11900 [Tannerellaceae bacterium]|jgi:hypothetical protein|nr:hypothetical protein [Tannerellaceae bacterium]
MSEELSLNQDITTRYIQTTFSALGSDEHKDYVTSADIVREVSEMATVSIEEVSSLMNTAGFQMEFIENKPCWVVYRR